MRSPTTFLNEIVKNFMNLKKKSVNMENLITEQIFKIRKRLFKIATLLKTTALNTHFDFV